MKQIAMILPVIFCLAHLSATAQQSKVVLDNDKIKITEYISQPGKDVCGPGKHTHADHTTILLSDAKVQTTDADGVREIETYSSGKHLYRVVRNGKTENSPTDGVFWVKGTTHTVKNAGDKPLRFYIIETK